MTVPSNSADSSTEFTVASEPGNERLAVERVLQAVRGYPLPEARLERLKTAVAEATMNAMEHGNEYRPDLPVSIRVFPSETEVRVQITDHGGAPLVADPEQPDIQAKLAGEQSPRGWGLFLIKNMVDDMQVTSDQTHHTVELSLHVRGGDDASDAG